MKNAAKLAKCEAPGSMCSHRLSVHCRRHNPAQCGARKRCSVLLALNSSSSSSFSSILSFYFRIYSHNTNEKYGLVNLKRFSQFWCRSHRFTLTAGQNSARASVPCHPLPSPCTHATPKVDVDYFFLFSCLPRPPPLPLSRLDRIFPWMQLVILLLWVAGEWKMASFRLVYLSTVVSQCHALSSMHRDALESATRTHACDCTRPVCVSMSPANMDIDDHRQYYYNGNSSHSCCFHVNGCCRNDNGPAIEMKCAAKTNKTEILFNIAILPGSFSLFAVAAAPTPSLRGHSRQFGSVLCAEL